MADMTLTQDESEAIIKKFNAVVDRHLRPVVKKVFEGHAKDKTKMV